MEWVWLPAVDGRRECVRVCVYALVVAELGSGSVLSDLGYIEEIDRPGTPRWWVYTEES